MSAARHYSEALASARALGMRPLEALFREMDMRHWLIQAQEALAAL